MSKKSSKISVVQRPMDSEAELGTDEVQRTQVLRAEAREVRDATIPEQIAKSKIHFRNWEFPGAKTAFPYHRNMRFVERMYPYALPKPLLVDQPENHHERAECEQKAQVLRRMGYRYLILEPSMTVLEAMDQLGEI